MVRERLFEQGDHARVHFDRGHRANAGGEGGGQDPRPRTDLEHVVVLGKLGCVEDRGEDRAIDEKALPERRRGPDAVAAKYVAQLTGVRDVHSARLDRHLHTHCPA